jgi:hypothetical protein
MVDISGSYDQNAEPSQFDRLPAFTDQRAKIIESAVIPISDKENKGRCLNLTWQVETGPLDGRLFWQRLNMWPENMDNMDKVVTIANAQFAAIRQATGKLAPQDSAELHHIPCLVSYGPQRKNPDYDEVKSVKAVERASAGQRPAPAQTQQRQAPAATQQSRPAPATNSGGYAPWRNKA